MKKIAIVILLLVLLGAGAVVALASRKPDTFQVQRKGSMQADPAKVHALIEDFHAWGGWSPWEKLDPAMKRTFSGPPKGKGAVYAWEGNGDVGAGRMEITDSVPGEKVSMNLDFLKPFEAHNTTEFTLEAKADATHVTWTMNGRADLMTKIMQVVMDMDAMIGKDFEAGLSNMKAAAEKK